MPEAYVIDAVRTAVGKRNGSLAGIHPIDLGVHAFRGIFDRNDVDPAAVDDAVVGCVDAVGGQAGNIGRLTWLAAGAAEVPVVEQHHGEAGIPKGLGVRGQPVVAGSRKSVCHHHTRLRSVAIGPVEVGGQFLTVRGDTDVLAWQRHR